jgi:hypothetical protein
MYYHLFPRKAHFAALLIGAIAMSSVALAVTVDFEDVALPASGYYNGSDGAGGFTSSGVLFQNSYAEYPPYVYWENWACSRMTDVTDYSWQNQFSAAAGGGQNVSAQYTVSYPGFSTGVSNITFPNPTAVQGAYFTNTTYAYGSMLNGLNGSKKFGGESGNEEDWFLLTITGKDSAGVELGSRTLYLADFRDPANRPDNTRTDDYILNEWAWVDLSSLGNDVKTLEFGLTSTDNDAVFGMNTPGYFAMDNLTISAVPEPNASMLLVMAALGFLVWRVRATTCR